MIVSQNHNLDRLFARVAKPARYTGGEVNAREPKPGADVRIALCFPDVYEVGMSHTGMRILYHRINDLPYASCERVFTPWIDMADLMRAEKIPLFTLESRSPVRSFDALAFTLPYEMCYTNVLETLDLAGVPIRSADRAEDNPLVIAGGICAFNPEPLYAFVDAFFIGDGEDGIVEINDALRRAKLSGMSRADRLLALDEIPGVYVPSRKKAVVSRRIIEDLDGTYFPDTQIVPYIEIVHDRATLELFRGCTRGCRFCQAGMLYRPVRERSAETLASQAERLIHSTGYEELSLSSLSTGDYSDLDGLRAALRDRFPDGRVQYSLPSLRVDSALGDALERDARKNSVTLAPEAGTQRLRDAINKGVTEEDAIRAVRDAAAAGVSTIKLYFMIGLPTETADDVDGIAHLVTLLNSQARFASRESSVRPPKLSVSVAPFVPKPFTPFQWERQDTLEETERKLARLRSGIPARAVTLHWHDPRLSLLEACLSRGDRRVADAIEHAWRSGCRFDGWSEQFKFGKWAEAFAGAGVEFAYYANREFSLDETLPWDFIDAGVYKAYLIREQGRAYGGETTPDCRNGCQGCGLQLAEGGCCGARSCTV